MKDDNQLPVTAAFTICYGSKASASRINKKISVNWNAFCKIAACYMGQGCGQNMGYVLYIGDGQCVASKQLIKLWIL